MPRLPRLSGKEAVRAFEKAGYYVDRQRGSHIILMHEKRPRISVPNHKSMRLGTLQAIIKQAGFTVDEFSTLI